MSFCGSINDLPLQIITDVLSRLPTKTVVHCRCVCKTWKDLVLDPYFANLHLSRSPTTLIVHQSGPCDPIGHFDFLNLVEFDHDRRRLRYDPVMKFDLRSACYPNGQILLVGSINGLLCFRDYANEVIHITNPIMREYVTLPKPKYSRRSPDSVVVYGFGFGSVSGCYKVVQIFQRPVYSDQYSERRPRRYETRVEVYTLGGGGTGSWRSIDIGTSTVDLSYDYHHLLSSPFLNGNIHWLVFSGEDIAEERTDAISCFDVEKETFRTISAAPSQLGHVYKSLVLLEGCLCVCHNSEDSDLIIWVMKEYGVESSWTKQTVIRKNSSDILTHWLSYDDLISPIKVWENGEYLILLRDDYLYNYSPQTETLKDVDVPRDDEPVDTPFIVYEMLFHVASFRSLTDLARTEKVYKI